METTSRLRWSDIWVLVSIYFNKKNNASDILDIIRSADAINHAIVTFEELSSALVRLNNANLITSKPNTLIFSCTEKANEIINPISLNNSLLLKIWDEIEYVLNVEPWNPKSPMPEPENNLVHTGLNRKIYDEELKKYSSYR